MFPSMLPLIRLKPWFNGPYGILGADAGLGIRTDGQPVVLYVDSGNARANDSNYGTDPENPLATVQAAVDSSFLVSGSIIVVSGEVEETVVTPDYDTGPNYCTIIGAKMHFGADYGPCAYTPGWQSGAVDEACLDMRAVGWRVSGIRFYAPTQEACIQLRHTDTGANDIAIRSIIDHCLFDGLTTGRYGIWSHGCYDVWITDNVFQLFHNAVAGGAVPLYAATTPLAIPYRNHVLRNIFWDSDNGAIFPCNGSEVAMNRFQPTGYAYAMTQVLNTSVGGNPGDDNIVWGNVFPGDYSIAGGYNPGAADAWLGNMADDTAEAEVGDNGWTIARPT